MYFVKKQYTIMNGSTFLEMGILYFLFVYDITSTLFFNHGLILLPSIFLGPTDGTCFKNLEYSCTREKRYTKNSVWWILQHMV